jgi:hypothetical protein
MKLRVMVKALKLVLIISFSIELLSVAIPRLLFL